MRKTCLSAAILLAGICCTNPSNAQTVIGEAEAIKTSVTGSNARAIRPKSSIFRNERIRANTSGLGHFRFTDGTKLVVGPGSNLVLDDLVYNPGGSTFKKVVLKHASGATRFISGNSDTSVFKIITPVGTMGLRGTAFDFQHLRGRTYIMLLQGEVEICSTSGECEIIRRKCDFVVVNVNGKVSDPIQPRRSLFSPADMARYFPFVSDQRPLEPDYRLRINTCAGGFTERSSGIAEDRHPARDSGGNRGGGGGSGEGEGEGEG